MTDAGAHIDNAALLSAVLHLGDRAEALPGTIALELAQDIIEGQLPPGAEVNSIDLADRFSTSRTPVREALMILEHAGLVTVPARRRPRVTELTTSEIEDVYMLRGRLYAIVAELITTRATDDDITALEEAVGRMRVHADADEINQFFWANVAFHELSARLTRSHSLRQSIDSLGSQVLRVRHVTMSIPGRIQESAADHQRLMQAYRDRDSQLAAALNKSVVDSAYRALTHYAVPGTTI